MIYKYTIALISQIERNILIGLLCACTTVCIPDINRLSVFYKRCKTLAKTVDKLTYAKAQLLADIGIAVVAFIISQTLQSVFMRARSRFLDSVMTLPFLIYFMYRYSYRFPESGNRWR